MSIARIKKTETIRVRCDLQWKNDVEVFAQMHRLDASELVRIAVEQLMAEYGKAEPIRPVTLRDPAPQRRGIPAEVRRGI